MGRFIVFLIIGNEIFTNLSLIIKIELISFYTSLISFSTKAKIKAAKHLSECDNLE